MKCALPPPLMFRGPIAKQFSKAGEEYHSLTTYYFAKFTI